MKRFAILAVLAWFQPPALPAQTVMRPAAPLDSARAVLRDALVVLRDSLITVDGAAARLQRDYRAASGQALLARARLMRDACARSSRTVPPTREAVLATNLSEKKKLTRRQELVSVLDTLKLALSRCEAEFAAMSQAGQGERVRGYGNDRAVRVQHALRRYEHVLQDYLQIMGIRIFPAGATRAPSAG